jgi:hypothetical protein
MSFGGVGVNAAGLVDQLHGCRNPDRRSVQSDFHFLPVKYIDMRRPAKFNS